MCEIPILQSTLPCKITAFFIKAIYMTAIFSFYTDLSA